MSSPRRVLPYFGMVGRFCGDDLRFWDFLIWLSPYLWFSIIRVIPSFCRKIRFVSITFMQEILGTKAGLIFHQNVLFNSFKHFVSIFSLIFNPTDPLFIDLRSFLPLFLQNHRSDWVKIVIACWTQLANIWWNLPLDCHYCGWHT